MIDKPEEIECNNRRVITMDGVTVTVSDNKFEIYSRDGSDVIIQYAIQHLRQWCKWRKVHGRDRENWKRPR